MTGMKGRAKPKKLGSGGKAGIGTDVTQENVESLQEENAKPETAGVLGCRRIWLRMPNWLGDVVMALPLVRALRAANPEAEMVLLAQRGFVPLLERLAVAEQVVTIPPRGRGYWSFFRRLKKQQPEEYILFTNSLRGDLEAWLAGGKRRHGILRKGKWRPLVSRGWRLPKDLDERAVHQTRLWERWWREAGLLPEGELDLRPLVWAEEKSAKESGAPVVGMICGSENSPEKRWPVAHWQQLIGLLAATGKILLFGTAKDREITEAIVSGLSEQRKSQVENWAGRTDLLQLCAALAECDHVVCNDTGGLHLANMLGVPVTGVFGPTNPVRTGPIFAAPMHVLQPEGCPKAGGGNIADVAPETVAAVLRVEGGL